MTTINGMIHSWDRRERRGIAQLDDDRTVQIHAHKLGAVHRLRNGRVRLSCVRVTALSLSSTMTAMLSTFCGSGDPRGGVLARFSQNARRRPRVPNFTRIRNSEYGPFHG